MRNFYLTKLLAIAGIAGIVSGFTFANDTNNLLTGLSSTNTNMETDYVPPYIPQTTVKYSFDENDVKNIMNQKNVLARLTCQPENILKLLGLDKVSKNLFSVGVTEGDIDYTFDFKNCSLYGSNSNIDYNSKKTITEKKALEIADQYMKDGYLKDKLGFKFGKPIITYKNYYNPEPLLKDSKQSGDSLDSNTQTTGDLEKIEKEYFSISIVYPYLINGITVYNNYGVPVGVTLEVRNEGISYANAQILPFAIKRVTSDKLTDSELVNFIKKGGNSPYYGNEPEIKLSKPERVLVFFSMYRNNKTELYISSGIRLGSEVKQDLYTSMNYSIVISDYKIGNNMYNY